MIIIIPIGGVGERFSKAGFHDPKPLIPIHKKRIIQYLLDLLLTFVSSSDTVFIFHHNQLSGFREFITTTYKTSVELVDIGDPTSGAVDTVVKGMKKIQSTINEHEPVLLVDCDAFYTRNILDSLRSLPRGTNSVVCFNEEQISHQFSYILVEENDEGIPQISKIKEKEGISSLANTGAYYFASFSKLCEYGKKTMEKKHMTRNEYFTSCVIDVMISEGEEFRPILIERSEVTFLGTPVQVHEFQSTRFAMLFDLDGTLVDSDNVYLRVWSALLPDIDMTKELFRDHIQGRNDKIAASRFIHDISEEYAAAISVEKDRLFVENIHEISTMEGAREFIQTLSLHGHRIYIVTNCNRSAAQAVLEYCGFDKWADGLVIGNECPRAKPYPDPYLKAMEMADVSSDRCVIFEDSKIGLMSARSAFPHAIVGVMTSMKETEMTEHGATMAITDYQSLLLSSILTKKEDNVSVLTDLETCILTSIKTMGYTGVKIGRVQLKGGYIADVLPVELTDFSGHQYSAIVKYENGNDSSELGKMAKKLDLYNREYYYYTVIQKHVPICSPKFYSLLHDQQTLIPKGILLQNMFSEGCVALSAKNSNIETTLCIIRRLASMHAQFWNKPLNKIFPFLKKNDDPFYSFMSSFISERWPAFQKKWSHVISPEKMEWGQKTVKDFLYYQQHLSQGEHLTLLHGDVKYANILFTRPGTTDTSTTDFENGDRYFEPCFIDWQYVGIGKGIQDIVFFLMESYDTDQLEVMASIIFPYYYLCLQREGITNYSRKQFENDISCAARFYPFFVGIWFGTTPREDLIDVNFPVFYIQKLFHFLHLFPYVV